MSAKQLARHVRHIPEATVFNRTRDFYLYAQDGTRFIDLDMADGRAVLGYKVAGIGARIKQNIDKGILHDLPTMWQNRFAKTIVTVFPNHTYVGLYTRAHCALTATTQATVKTRMWRAFAGSWSCETLQTNKPLCFAPPLAWDPPLYALLLPNALELPAFFERTLWAKDELTEDTMLLTSTPVSPVLYAVLCASLGALVKGAHGEAAAHSDSAQQPSCTQKTDHTQAYKCRKFPAEHKNKSNIYAITNTTGDLKNTKVRATKLPLPDGAKQRGVYVMLPAVSTQAYSHMRTVLWQHGFFVPKNPRRLLTLPPFFTARELQNWQAAMAQLT